MYSQSNELEESEYAPIIPEQSLQPSKTKIGIVFAMKNTSKKSFINNSLYDQMNERQKINMQYINKQPKNVICLKFITAHRILSDELKNTFSAKPIAYIDAFIQDKSKNDNDQKNQYYITEMEKSVYILDTAIKMDKLGTGITRLTAADIVPILADLNIAKAILDKKIILDDIKRWVIKRTHLQEMGTLINQIKNFELECKIQPLCLFSHSVLLICMIRYLYHKTLK